ncbi:MAG: SDR family oxidoreductase [Saccharofermentans sp.]|nr:SDR family oxidoreductase [Saccharofermentans sp.]
MFDLTAKTYIVTGSSSGMGEATAALLLKEGAVVYGFDVNDASINDSNYNHVKLSITDEEQVREAVENISAGHKISGLVNAAGIWGNSKPFFEIDLPDWKRVLDVDLNGAFIVSKHVCLAMIPNREGSVVNISCIRSSIFRKNMADYASSKGAIVALTSAMALDLSPYNIRVNAVAPGFIYTGMTCRSFDDPTVREQSEKLIPNGRIGKPDDIAKVALFLLSDMSDYMTGTNVFADGGYHIEK